MIKLELKDEIFELRNSIDEITIEEFEIIIFLLNKENTFIDKWLEIISFLGLDQHIIDSLDEDAFIEIVKSISNNFTSFEEKIPQSIEIDTINYIAYSGDNLKLNMKQLKYIQNNIMTKGFYYADLCAYIYNREDYTSIQNESIEHKAYKKEFFKQQKMEFVLPLLKIININLVKKLNLLINGAA